MIKRQETEGNRPTTGVQALQTRVNQLETRVNQLQNTEKVLSERVKELQCLNSLSQLMDAADLSEADFLQSVVSLVPPAYQHPEQTCARIRLSGQRFTTTPFAETEWGHSASIVVNERHVGTLEVFQSKMPVNQGGKPFLQEEQNLIIMVANSIGQFLSQRKNETDLQQIKWMLGNKQPLSQDYRPDYGDLSALNKDGLILSSIGKDHLREMVSEYLDLLETSAAIYERNGDYALGLFSSGWCQMMDAASRKLCETDDNQEALKGGRWLCHDSCWKDASLQAINENKIVDIACSGGIHLYAVPVQAGGEIVGAINVGYGDPPTDPPTLETLSRDYRLPIEELRKKAEAYQSRPKFILDYAKKRIQKAANDLGMRIERTQSEKAQRASEERLQAIITASPLAIISNNPAGDVLRWNPAAEAIFGWKEEEVLGRMLPTVSEHQDKGFSELLAGYQEGSAFTQLEVERSRKDGSTIDVSLSTALIHDEQGQIVEIFGILDDITSRKKADIELNTLKDHLEMQVEEKTRQLQARITELEHYFEATVAREFRMKELRDEIKQLKEKVHPD